MKNGLTAILLILLMNSCGLLITQKILLGVKKPNVQSKQNIEKFLSRNKSLDSTITLNKESFLHKIAQSSNYFSKWELFDKNGNRIIPFDTNIRYCNGYTHSFFKELPNSQYSLDTMGNLFLDTVLTKGLTKLDRTRFEFIKSEKSDYYLIIYWATFMGKYSSDLFELEKIARNNKLISISTLKINMDFKDYYGYTNKEINVEQKMKK